MIVCEVNKMKTLILIGGTMGVGKTATSQVLKKSLKASVFLDGDWCWDMHPFVVNENTKAMVMDNIIYMLNNFIRNDDIEYIIFCWVMHQQDIIDEIIAKVDLNYCRVYPISLVCSRETLIRHLEKDIQLGVRSQDVIERSLERLNMYRYLKTYQIDTSNLTIEETVESIKAHIR